jgi:hypothetical protein
MDFVYEDIAFLESQVKQEPILKKTRRGRKPKGEEDCENEEPPLADKPYVFDIPPGMSVIEQKRNSLILYDPVKQDWFVSIVAKTEDPIPLGTFKTLKECQQAIQIFKRAKKRIRISTVTTATRQQQQDDDPSPVRKPRIKKPKEPRQKKPKEPKLKEPRRKRQKKNEETAVNALLALNPPCSPPPPIIQRKPRKQKSSSSSSLGAAPAEGSISPMKYVSPYRGVRWNKSQQQWQCQICQDASRIELGRFETEEDAARAYNEYAIKIRGPNSKTLNIVPDGVATYSPNNTTYLENFTEEDFQLTARIERALLTENNLETEEIHDILLQNM